MDNKNTVPMDNINTPTDTSPMDINNFNEGFYNPETELDQKYSSKITMYKVVRGRKSDIIIKGLILKTPEEIKKFITTISSKFGIGGCHKIVDEYDKTNKVFVFTGDKREQIKKIIMDQYKIDQEFITYVG